MARSEQGGVGERAVVQVDCVLTGEHEARFLLREHVGIDQLERRAVRRAARLSGSYPSMPTVSSDHVRAV